MDRVELALRLFFCLPFAHSEDIADRDLSVRLNAALAAVAGRSDDALRSSAPAP